MSSLENSNSNGPVTIHITSPTGLEIGTASVLKSNCHLRTIEINSLYRNQGLGSKLLKKAEEELKSYGCNKCYVMVGRLDYYQSLPFAFYEKNGYKYSYPVSRFLFFSKQFQMEKTLDQAGPS